MKIMRFGRLFATNGAGLLNVIFREFYYSAKLVKNSFYNARGVQTRRCSDHTHDTEQVSQKKNSAWKHNKSTRLDSE